MNLLAIFLLLVTIIIGIFFYIKNYLPTKKKDLPFYILIIAWIILSILGSYERFNSPKFDAYFSSNIPDDYTGAVAGYYFGHTPEFQVVTTAIAALIIFLLYCFLKNVSRKRGVFYISVYLFSSLFFLFEIFDSIKNFFEMQNWGFIISMIEAGLVFLLSVMFLGVLTDFFLKQSHGSNN